LIGHNKGATFTNNISKGFAYGAVFKHSTAAGGTTTDCSNNQFLDNMIGVYDKGAGELNMYNNTVVSHYIYDEGVSTGRGIYINDNSGAHSPENVSIKNNLIYITSSAVTSVGIDLGIAVPSGFEADYNLVYLTDSGVYGAVNGTKYSSLSGWQGAGYGTHDTGIDPLFVSASDYSLSVDSPAIDSGVTIIGLNTDFLGNSVIGNHDNGAFEYQPPYVIATDNPNSSSPIRIYSNGKYRYTNSVSGSNTVRLSVAPQGGFGTGDYSQWMDIAIDTWHTSGDYSKRWTESSSNNALAIVHTIGNLKPNTRYNLKINGVETNTYMADSQEMLTFTYQGGYSTKNFELNEASAGTFIAPSKPIVTSSGTASSTTVPSDVTQIAISRTPDFKDVSWQAFDREKFQALGVGSGIFYVKFRTASGGMSDTVIYEKGNTGGSNTGTLKEGDIVKAPDNPDVYIIKYKEGKQYKRLILSPSVFNSYGHLKWENLKVISRAQLDMYVTSSLVRVAGDKNVYELFPEGDTGKRRTFATYVDGILRLAQNDGNGTYDADSVYEINGVDRDSYKLIQ
jgi:hypothetical protein